MFTMHVELTPGFSKGNINNLPTLTNKILYDFIAKTIQAIDDRMAAIMSKFPPMGNDLHVDYVQVRQTAEVHEIKAIVFSIEGASTSTNTTTTIPTQAYVCLKMDVKDNKIIETFCDLCNPEEACVHIVTFLFWLHRQTADMDTPAVVDFWGQEIETLTQASDVKPKLLSDICPKDDTHTENGEETKPITVEDGFAFLNAVLDKMEATDLKDSLFYEHCRPSVNVFDTIFIHHVLLDANENGANSLAGFLLHMEEQYKRGLFRTVFDVSKNAYKTPLWFEMQYMRIRCSMVHHLSTCAEAIETKQILKSLFCKKRTSNIKEKIAAKERKRFILKQTEKLENKNYEQCGILIHEKYPFLCVTPDGITDDHIVEIKMPKTEADYQIYLQSNETVAPKYMAQLQVQMFVAQVTKALYCVISPDFDESGILHYVWVHADLRCMEHLLYSVEYFWKNVVFPHLTQTYAIKN